MIDPVVTCCASCPENKEHHNPLARFLPPTHHCRLMFDPKYPEGKLIWYPQIVPGWCPLSND